MLGTKIIPVTDFVRNFGEESLNILMYESFILTKGGKPFMNVTAAPELRREYLKLAMGAWKNTKLDDDGLWKDILKRKSRKKDWFK